MPARSPVTSSADDSTIPEMTSTELEERLKQEQPLVLVDVREPHEIQIADLPSVGQLRIPVGQFLDRLKELDPGENLVIYCRSGARSGWAVQQLRERGYEKVWNLKGGVLSWREDVDPTLTAY